MTVLGLMDASQRKEGSLSVATDRRCALLCSVAQSLFLQLAFCLPSAKEVMA